MGEEPQVRVLFVCSGNICRSPAAVACFRHRVAERGWRGLEADSAGTLGIAGQPICADAARVLREIGIESAGHRSKGVSRAEVRAADWIVAMQREHLDWLARRHPGGTGRRVLIRAFERGTDLDADPADLLDPYGQPLEVYRNQIPLIARCVDHLLAHVHPAP